MSILSEDEKRNLLREHIFYEFQMLAELTKARVYKYEGIINTQIIKNAVIESCLIHIRCIGDFLMSSGKYSDDVLSKHFGYSPSTTQLGISSEYERINKDLAHVTIKRTNRLDKSWDLIKIFTLVYKECILFIEFILEKYRDIIGDKATEYGLLLLDFKKLIGNNGENMN